MGSVGLLGLRGSDGRRWQGWDGAESVAAEAARAGARAALSGNDALLRMLHPTVRLQKSALTLDAAGDADLELDGRSLVLRPAALSARAGHSGDMFGDRLIVTYPAGVGAVLRDAALITTFRDGVTVHHTATRLGGELIDGAGAGS